MLRFTPYAWAKLLFLRDLGGTEIGAFGITPANDLLLVEDVQLVQQHCTPTSVVFDDDSVADFFDGQVDHGRHPAQFARIWLHTHPCCSAQPSSTDEETFARCFGRADWTVMFILARGGKSYARLRFNVGPGGDLEIGTHVDFTLPFAASQQDAWAKEYEDNVGLGLDRPLDDILDDWGWQHDPDVDFVELANRELSAAEEQEMASLEWIRLMDASSTE
jgi:proteasome lid subunit RPN8/RPN11